LDEPRVVVWYDTAADAPEAVITRAVNLRYTGVVLYPETLKRLAPLVPDRLLSVVHVESKADLAAACDHAAVRRNVVIASPQRELLSAAKDKQVRTCLRTRVDDAASLHAAIEYGKHHDYLVIAFRDPTNIPLELVIAELQPTNTTLLKEIREPDGVEDAIVTLGVMEVGADGVIFSPRDHAPLDSFVGQLDRIEMPQVALEPAKIVQTEAVGMGHRSCIDLATLFRPTEGMVVGSTSHGGILCCPEVFFLPYMELRPFRVNAGAVHSYVYNRNNRTDYMTELRAGSSVMVVDAGGATRRATVGRMKTEIRPLRLIVAEFASGDQINVLMQDDWHVRVFSDQATPRNITELRPGELVLAHRAKPGRHVGIKVDEYILEK